MIAALLPNLLQTPLPCKSPKHFKKELTKIMPAG